LTYKFICCGKKQDSNFDVSDEVSEQKYNLFAKQSLTLIDGAKESESVIICETPMEMQFDMNRR